MAQVTPATQGLCNPPVSPSGTAVRAGLEDSILHSWVRVLAWLAAAHPESREVFRRQIVDRFGIFIPRERAESLAAALFDGTSDLSSPTAPLMPGLAHSLFVAVGVGEATDCLPEPVQQEVLDQLATLSWLAPLLATARNWRHVCQTAGGGTLQIMRTEAGETSTVQRVQLRRGETALTAWWVDGYWWVRHDSPDDGSITFCGLRWPPQHTLWLKPNEEISWGDERLTAAHLDLLVRAEKQGAETWWLQPGDGELSLRRQAVEGAVMLVKGEGFQLTPNGLAELNHRRMEVAEPVLPGDWVRIGPWEGPLANLLLRCLGGPRTGERCRDWSVSVEQVSVRFHDGASGLNDVTLSFEPGELVAVMGPSGCGKSTLASVLAGDLQPTKGRVSFSPGSLGRPPAVALVPQDDILFEGLTVRENLAFARRLRQGVSDSEQIEMEVMREVGLEKRRDSRVGSPTDKVLSGGERKRLNVGLELTGRPDVLLLDEPTSGLSSGDAMELIRLVRRLADEGMLVLAVLHQPSDELFALFDKVVVMDTGGTLACVGRPEGVARWFRRFAPGAATASGPDAIFEVLTGKRTLIDGRDGARRVFDSHFWKILLASERHQVEPPRLIQPVDESKETSAIKKGIQPANRTGGWLTTLIGREWLRWCRDWPTTLVTLLTAAILATLTAWICRSVESPGADYRYSANANLPAMAFLSVILMQFLALSASVQEMVKDRAVRRRERLLRQPSWGWLLAKLPPLGCQVLIQSVLVLTIGARILEIPLGGWSAWLILLMVGLAGTGFGLLISCLPRMTERAAMASVPLLLVPQLMLSGADPFGFSRLSHLAGSPSNPHANSNTAPGLADVMPARWGYLGLLAAWTEHPFLSQVSDTRFREFRRTLLKLRERPAALQTAPQAFWQEVAAETGMHWDKATFLEDAKAFLRAGMRSRSELMEALGPDASVLADVPEGDRREWPHVTVQRQLEAVKPADWTAGAWQGAICKLTLLLLAALSGAVFMLRLERPLEFARTELIRFVSRWLLDRKNARAGGRQFAGGWQWGPVQFDGFMGLHGIYLCFNRQVGDGQVEVDPAKSLRPIHLESEDSPT